MCLIEYALLRSSWLKPVNRAVRPKMSGFVFFLPLSPPHSTPSGSPHALTNIQKRVREQGMRYHAHVCAQAHCCQAQAQRIGIQQRKHAHTWHAHRHKQVHICTRPNESRTHNGSFCLFSLRSTYCLSLLVDGDMHPEAPRVMNSLPFIDNGIYMYISCFY